MRPYRIGTNSGTRDRACCSSTSTGSRRPGAGTHPACDERGTSARAAFPRAARSVLVRCATRPVCTRERRAPATSLAGPLRVAVTVLIKLLLACLAGEREQRG